LILCRCLLGDLGETDVLFNIVHGFLLVVILLIDLFCLRLHSLPDHMVGLLHAMILRLQALLLPVRKLVLTGL